MKRALAFASCLALFQLGCSETVPTQATDDLDSREVIAKTGASGKVKAPATDLEVEILESNSDFINHIYLVSPGPDLFIGVDEATGSVVALPTVTLNQELVFQIRVHDPSNVDTGVIWSTGPPARNSDLAVHALVEYLADGSIMVSFEDIDASQWGVGDEPNYVDAVFVVREQ